MNPRPSILTNVAFHESRTWSEAVTSICRTTETPDDLPVWRQVFRLLRLQPQYDVVVTLGPRLSLAYGMICGLLRIPSKQIMTEVFLDEACPSSLPWRIKTALFRWIARRAMGILTNSTAEVGFIAKRFNIPEAKLRFVPMHTTIAHPEPSRRNDGYVLSIGRTLRDLDTLVAAARQIDTPVVLVAGRHDALPSPLPPHVQVFRELPLEEAHEKLRGASVVVIPLLPAERSAGQVVLFEAMSLGKPIVATRATGTIDYIRDRENGLLVEPGDAQALADAVNLLQRDPALAGRLASAALADCKTELGMETHAARKLEAIQSLWAAGASSLRNIPS
ncbi:MAG TPA: hypothetical protein DCM68_01320 [Verrucomicrobia bacterium]|nr:hypothetical protein [Verrucomicrobiota bacterium]